jgi:3',5'-cyclic AMP phosphodiesterase CpdA
MNLNFRFAVVSDLHVALPHTVWDNPTRLHFVEVGIPALEIVLERLAQLDLDFLLLPGDLTQHGEPENHQWLADRLAQLPYPVYVIPGNHDVPALQANAQSIGYFDFPSYYRSFGYAHTEQHYYSHLILPGVRLIGLNSNTFDPEGKQLGRLDTTQLLWLRQTLRDCRDEMVMVMVHHNVVEHMPGQAENDLGQRYMLDNAPDLLALLREAGVQLVFTGHLHVQNLAEDQGIYDITTGSLVSFPHPYRVMALRTDALGRRSLQIESGRIESVPGWETLPQISRQMMANRSTPFMAKLLTHAPLNLPIGQAEALAPQLQNFWADFAGGDAEFSFPALPAAVRQYFEGFSRTAQADNSTTLHLASPKTRGLGRRLLRQPVQGAVG